MAEAQHQSSGLPLSILDVLPAHVAMLDEAGTIIAVNAAWRRFADANGYRGMAYGIGVNYLQLCDTASGPGADDARAAAHGIREVIAGRLAEFYMEYPCHSPTLQRWFILHATRYTDGDSTGVVLLHTNITERRKAELARSRLAAIVDSSHDAIIGTTLEGLIQDWNPAAERMYGYTAAEIVGRSIGVLFPPDYADELSWILGLIERGTGIADYETIRMRKDRTLIDVSLTISPIKDAAGHTIGASITARDITPRRRAEQQLLYQASLLDYVSDAVIGTDLDFTITTWNHAAEALYGWSAGEVIGKNVTLVLHTEYAEGQREQAIQQLLEQGIWKGEVIQKHRDGTRIDVLASVGLVKDSAGNQVGALAVNRNITERKQVEAERARLFEAVQAGRVQLQTLSQRLLQAQETERRHLARELHDEIGQMLTGLNLLLEVGTAFSIEMLTERLREAQTLVGDLTARVRAMSLNLRPSMLDDLGLLPTLHWHFQRYTAQTQVQVRFKHSGLEQALDPTIAVVAYRMIQEALTNVARYAHVEVVDVQVWATHGSLYIQIEDQGCGFNRDAVLQGQRSSGLTGIQERVALLGGHVTIDSAPGEGTRIIAQLPITASDTTKGAKA